MNDPLSVSVIGPGALGQAIIDLVLRHSGFDLRSVWGRTESTNYFLETSGNKVQANLLFPSKDTDLGHLIIISVPDDQIKNVAQRLSETGVSWKKRYVIHLSGSLDSSILEPLANSGAQIGSLHPLQTFTKGDKAERFDKIWFTMQGDDAIISILDQLIAPCGGQRKILSSTQKSAMHLAAVFASNYLVALMDVVENITIDSDISDGLNMLEPIVHQTVKNINSKGSKKSLSGPVARGDTTTIKKHLEQLKKNPGHQKLYCQLGLQASEIAKESGQLKKPKFDIIRDIFESVSNNQ